jgi:outer membrane protein assembly factor BamB
VRRLPLAVPLPVRGRLARGEAGLLVANLDGGAAQAAAIAGVDPMEGRQLWRADGVPELAAADADGAYAYSRAGLVVALAPDGRERWRTAVPDDRSRPARERGDRAGPFRGDLLLVGGSALVAAGAEVLALSRRDGSIAGRTAVGGGERTAVSRLGRAGDGAVLAISVRRTDWDDELAPLEWRLWQRPPTLASLRTESGDLVALTPGLATAWRLPPRSPDLVAGERQPVGTSEVAVLVGARAVGERSSRHLTQFRDWMIALDARTGRVLWQRDLPGGRGRFDPVLTAEGVIVGIRPALHRLADGELVWQLDASQVVVDVAPIVHGNLAVFAGNGVLLGCDLSTGAVEPLVPFAERLPFSGEVTTSLLRVDRTVYLGVREGGSATELRAVELPER